MATDEELLQRERREMLDEYLAVLRPFLDSQVTEICINRPGEIWTEDASGWRSNEVRQLTLNHCRYLASLVASYNKKSVTTENPILSATLPDGERIQIIIPPACTPDTVSITVRKPSDVEFSLDELSQRGTFSQVRNIDNELKPFEKELLQLKEQKRYFEFLQSAVQHKRNILIVGKTGSGKTTVTKALIQCIPKSERLITIEDVHELFMRDFPNKVHLFYSREEEGGHKVTAKDALAACLRMKPDRILLAELRGDEAWEFIKSVNTGHPGSISTMHANGAFEAFEQLTAFIKDSRTGQHLDSDYVLKRLYATLDVIMFFDRYRLVELFYDPEFKRQAAQNTRH